MMNERKESRQERRNYTFEGMRMRKKLVKMQWIFAECCEVREIEFLLSGGDIVKK